MIRTGYKKLLTVAVCLILLCSLTATAGRKAAAAGDTLTFMSFNLRYDTTSHPLMGVDIRGTHLLSLVQKYAPDSVGFQEATDNWMIYLRSAMAKIGYSYVGVGRDTGTDDPSRTSNGNEFNPVFYKTATYSLEDSGTFWLSNTPDRRSGTEWGASNPRICTWAALKNKKTGDTYIHFNTHLEHLSMTAQHNGARILLNRISEITAAQGGAPCVATGDYNSVRFDPTNPDYVPTTYNLMTAHMEDARAAAQNILVDGATFNGYQKPEEWEDGRPSTGDKPPVDTSSSPIDYLFLAKGRYQVETYSVIDDTFTFDYNGETYHNHPVSDHYGVYCTVRLRRPAGDGTPDESRLIDLPARTYTDSVRGDRIGEYDLARVQAFSNVAANGTAASNLDCVPGRDAPVLLDGENSVQLKNTDGRVFWELTVELPAAAHTAALSFTVGDSLETVPTNAELFLAGGDGVWKKVGPSVTNRPGTESTLYYLLDEPYAAKRAKLVLVDAPAGAQIKNLSVYGALSNLRPLSSGQYTPISGPGAGGKEGYEKLFDGDTGTKLFATSPGAVVWKTAGPVTAEQYSLTSANDNAKYPGRYPRAWTLYGSQDGGDGSWQVIDRVDGYAFADMDYAEFVFTIDQPAPYTYYKMDFTEMKSNQMQFSELDLYVEGEPAARIPQTRFTPVSGPKSGEKEGYEKMFDGDPNTKLYYRDSLPQAIVWKAEQGVTPCGYSFIVPNDVDQFKGRNPLGWKLYGSPDGTDGSWSLLDEQKNARLPDVKGCEVSFALQTSAACKWFKLEFTQMNTLSDGVSRMQVSEVYLYERPDTADYRALDALLLERVPSRPDVCEPAGLTGLTAALQGIVRGRPAAEQTAVDAYADAVRAGAQKLVYYPADYSRVDQAIEAAAALRPADYADFTGVTAAVQAVQRGKNMSEQKIVDGYAAAIEQAIADLRPAAVPGDMNGDGNVTIQDVMEACKVLARQSAGKAPTADEMVRGNLDGDGAFTIRDVMEICKILARKA
ncbi:MAG: hypothetical protein HFE86_05205 [Clostridiales bacterium]|nr:hypothetical protein [Clostridiales bacterium]